MRKISWLKQSGKGKDAPVIGALQIEVPTPSELASLPHSDDGWDLTKVAEMLGRACKVDAASRFLQMLNAGMSRSDAERSTLEYVPCVKMVVVNSNNLHRRLREQAITSAQKMVAVGMTADTIADIIGGNGVDVDSILIAVGLLEDTSTDVE